MADIDGAEVTRLAAAGCTEAQIAMHFFVSDRTIRNRFWYEYAEGRSDVQIRLQSKAVAMALEGHPDALKWCLVHVCGWDVRKPDINVVNVVQNNQAPPTPETTKKQLIEMHQAILREAHNGEEPPIAQAT